MVPRTMSVACRKLALFCIVLKPTYWEEEEKQFLKEFYNKVLQVDINLLSPDQCSNILHLFKTTAEHIEHMQFDMKEIMSFQGKIIGQALKYLKYVSFNRAIDILYAIKQMEESHGDTNPALDQYKKRIFTHCYENFPHTSNQLEHIFHIVELYKVLLPMKTSEKSKQLYKIIGERIISLVEYIHLHIVLKLALLSISQYNSQQPTQQQVKVFTVILKHIVNLLQNQKSTIESKYLQKLQEIQLQIKNFIQQIELGNINKDENLLKLAQYLSTIEKLKSTPTEKKRQWLKKQRQLKQFQNNDDEMDIDDSQTNNMEMRNEIQEMNLRTQKQRQKKKIKKTKQQIKEQNRLEDID